MTKYVFFGVLVFALIAQGTAFFKVGIMDETFWSNQGKYVETGNPEQFNAAWAYGHPGGPVIYGVIAFHHLLTVEYDTALLLFLTIFNSIIIAWIATLCFTLRPGIWWLPVAGVLSFDRLYAYSTPPSAVAGLLLTLLCLFTLHLYEKKEPLSWKDISVWSFISGLAIATRADIGSISFVFFLFILIPRMSWKMILGTVFASFLVFSIFDPYMWYMPIQHVRDLLGKVFYHYEEFVPSIMKRSQVVSISSLTLLSILFALFYQFSKKFEEKLPRRFLYVLLVETVFLYTIFLTAKYQAVRYFIPIIFTWQVFLSLHIFDLIPRLGFTFLTSEKYQEKARWILTGFLIFILVGSQAYFLFDNIFSNY